MAVEAIAALPTDAQAGALAAGPVASAASIAMPIVARAVTPGAVFAQPVGPVKGTVSPLAAANGVRLRKKAAQPKAGSPKSRQSQQSPAVSGGLPSRSRHLPFDAASLAAIAGSTFAAAEAAAAADPDGKGLPKQPLDLKHERLVGSVIKYQANNGWGFVRSHLFEGELFFRTESIMLEYQSHPLHENEAVEFDAQADEHGRAHAVALKPVLGRKPSECNGQRHRGYVRRFAERWGFLNAAAFDGDLFVHRDNLLAMPDQMGADGQPPLRAGQAVEFDVSLDDRGRTVARQITTRAALLMRPSDWISTRLRGFVRSFQGAWGFINSDRFAGDLFVHRDSLLAPYVGAQLEAGTIVEFDIERDHYRKGSKNRLVARNVAVLGGEEAGPQSQTANFPVQQAGPAQQPMLQGTVPIQQQPMIVDPYAGMQATQPVTAAYGALQPQAASYAPQQTQAVYYQQAPTGMAQDLGLYGAAQPQYQYPQPQPQYQYPPQQPMLQMPQMPLQQPPLQQPVMQQYVGQASCPSQASYPSQYVMPQVAPQMQPQSMPAMPQAYAAPTMVPGAYPPAQMSEEQQRNAMLMQQAQMAGSIPSDPPKAEGEESGPQLHITMHDWEPDQPGQLWVTKGTLVNVSYRAAHGWVYAGSVQPGTDSGAAAEGWIPQAVVKRVSLSRVSIDWPSEGNGTLAVTQGEIIAMSKQAERGWVWGERIGPRQLDRPSEGWLPRKVLDMLQT